MSSPEYDLTPKAPETRTLFWPDTVLDFQDAVLELGIKQPLYIVGGAVRDAFLHRPVKDIDLAVPGDAVKIARKITNALSGDLFVMDAERGVARVLLATAEGRLVVDVAQFRGDDLLADLLGRDFTINAMAVDLRGDLGLLIDPLRGGAAAAAKVVQRCTPESISDDPLRGLRAIRQSAQLGFRIEPQTTADIRVQASKLMQVSPERIRDEFFKLLALQRPTTALRTAQYLGLLEQFLPEVTPLLGQAAQVYGIMDRWRYTLEACQRMVRILTMISYRRTDNTAATFDMGTLAIQLDRYRSQLNAYLDTEWPEERQQWALLMFGVLLHMTDENPEEAAETAVRCAEALRLSNPEKKRLRQMIMHFRESLALPLEAGEIELHRFWYSLGDGGIDALFLGLAHYLALVNIELDQDTWLAMVERVRLAFEAYFQRYDEIVAPALMVDGSVLMQELNLEGGPIIGELLTIIREGQVTGEITSADDAFAVARTYLQSRR